MTTNHTEPFEQGTVGDLADQAAHAIRLLNHRTRPGAGDLGDPSEVAEVIAALATMASRLPQLLDQLACWLEQERHRDRLRVDDLAPSLDTAQTVNALTGNLGEAIHCLQRTTAELDTAHQHAAHLATNDRGQNSRRSVGPSHLTTLMLEDLDGVEVMLVNAREAKNLPGRKTDVADATWLAQLGAHGLVRASFVPPQPIRELRGPHPDSDRDHPGAVP